MIFDLIFYISICRKSTSIWSAKSFTISSTIVSLRIYLSERNQYFPYLFEPLKIGPKTVKNRIEAAPAMFAFEHFMEGDDPFGYTQPVNEKAYRMLEAKAKGFRQQDGKEL